MKLKDFEELGQLGLDSSSTVEFYNMKNFKEDILTDKFSNLYLIGNEVEDKTHAPFGLLVDGTSLVVFFE
jgi:hypothetical protein